MSNSAWNYASAACTIGITFVATPIYLRVLGLERYGVLAVLSAILAPMGVFNAGVTQSAVKYVASMTAGGELDGARDAVVGSLFVNFLIGVLGAAACIIGAPYFLDLGFNVSAGLRGDAEDSLRWLGAVWFLTQIAGNFRGVIEGLRDQRLVMQGDVLNSVLTAGLCTVLGYVTGKLSWFIGGQFLATAFMTWFWWARAHRALGPFLRRWRSAWQGVRHVWGYSIWQMLNAGVAIAANVGDRYFIGIFFSATTLGAYNVALRVQAVGRTLFYSVNNALFPAASAATTQPGVSERLVVKTAWHVSLFAGSALCLIALCGPAFLELWVGSAISSSAGTALRILIVTLLFEIPSALGSSYLNAHAHTRLTAYNNILTTILTLGLMWPLGRAFGVPGVAWSALIGLALTRGPFHVWVYGRFFQAYVARRDFLKAFYGVSLCGLAALALTLPIYDLLFARCDGVLGFLIASLTCGPLFLGLMTCVLIFILGDKARLRELGETLAGHHRTRFLAPLLRRVGA